MIDAPEYRSNPHAHTCTSAPNHPDPQRPGEWGPLQGDELECLACTWADGYYSGYDDG